MDRRAFLRTAGVGTIAVLAPWTYTKNVVADDATWAGPYFLHMHASGGWDPTLLCDAKLTTEGTAPDYENRLVTEVGDVNGIPVPVATKAGQFLLGTAMAPTDDPMNFFQTVGRDVLVLNGVDAQTNNHDVGVQGLACGDNNVELPALAALFAGYVSAKRQLPMAFIGSGAYNRTGDVVGVSRFPGDKIPLLAQPFKGGPSDDHALISDLAVKRVLELQNERIARLSAQATLPRTKRTLAAMKSAAEGGATISLLTSVGTDAGPSIDMFADNLAPATRNYLTSGGKNAPFLQLGASVEPILRCFQKGVSAAATFAQGGFDTHSQHDVNQVQALGSFLARLRYVLLRADQLGLRDKLYVLVTSDFGRTPKYNTGAGKDHWNVTSALVVGPGIRGGRAVGKTSPGHTALRVSANDPTQVLADGDTSGIRIHAGHVHRELRHRLAVDGADFIARFPLPSTDATLPLLG